MTYAIVDHFSQLQEIDIYSFLSSNGIWQFFFFFCKNLIYFLFEEFDSLIFVSKTKL